MNPLNTDKIYLITGGAGFIGFHLSKSLLEKGACVIGFDNLNDYYEVSLKRDRLEILKEYENYTFIKGDLADKRDVFRLFQEYHPHIVVNLGAQAGVRYSIDDPDAYMRSNVMGFFHILEGCRYFPVEHLVFASSSSVYGGNEKVPFSVEDKVDEPVSLYAATKKSNELTAHAYSTLYRIPSTGLRFFTVYGPFGRPDMAYYKFTNKIMNDEPIQIYNKGDMYRDFTYIDDIVKGIENILCNPPEKNSKGCRYKIYNIGNNKSEKLMDSLKLWKNALERRQLRNFFRCSPGMYTGPMRMLMIYKKILALSRIPR